MKETYKILKNKQVFGVFEQGEMSRFDVPFDREVALREFDECKEFWRRKGHKLSTWSFVIEEDV